MIDRQTDRLADRQTDIHDYRFLSIRAWRISQPVAIAIGMSSGLITPFPVAENLLKSTPFNNLSITETSPYKVTPDLHLTYSKNGGNLGLVLKMKNIACISILLTKHVKYTYLYCLNLLYTIL